MKKMFIRCVVSLCLVCLMVGGSISVFAASSVAITSYGQTVDSLNSVSARYIPGTGNSNTGDYSCAGLVKAYYSEIFGVSVYNLLTGCTPTCSQSGYTFQSISSNILPGDVVYHTNSSGSGHWAIVKRVSGSSIVLLEQNWKWTSNGTTYASVERTVSFGATANLKVFRLYKNNASVNTTSTGTTTQSSASSTAASSSTIANLLFDAELYYNLYSDLRAAIGWDEAALYHHWITYGIAEGRVASLVFDPVYYMSNNEDVARAYGANNWKAAYEHFVGMGFNEGRQGSALYCASTYIGLYPDLQAAFGNDWLAATQHYLGHLEERRMASTAFSIQAYTAYNPDVASAFPNAKDVLTHYISYVYRGSENRRCI